MFKVGDKVKLVKDVKSDDFKVGSEYLVCHVHDYCYASYNGTDSGWGYILNHDDGRVTAWHDYFELVQPQAAQPSKLTCNCSITVLMNRGCQCKRESIGKQI
jgi:hypothetical protein